MACADERAGDEAVAARPRWRHCAQSASPAATEPEAVVGEGAGGGGGALGVSAKSRGGKLQEVARQQNRKSFWVPEQALKDGVTSTGRRAEMATGTYQRLRLVATRTF